MNGELLEIYDEAGNSLGLAPRGLCHGNPELIHRTAHVAVFHPETGDLLLQKRSAAKDIQPGKWDTAVGGHLAPGESYMDGARRELAEELGVTGEVKLRFLFDLKIRNEIESEDVRVFGLYRADGFSAQAEEIDEIRFWKADELFSPAARAAFTPNLCVELDLMRRMKLL